MQSRLQVDEKLLYHGERVDFAVYKSLPAVHAAGSVPGLHTITLLITDRRVIIQGAILGGIQITEFDLWYPRWAGGQAVNVLEEVSVQRLAVGGEALRLAARSHIHGPLRSDVVEMFLLTGETERLARMLNASLATQQLEWR